MKHRKQDIEKLFRQHYSKMHRLACILLGDEAEADDIVQEVFVRLMSGTSVIEGREAAYLLQSVRNRCMNRIEHLRVMERAARLLPLETKQSIRPVEKEMQELEDLYQLADGLSEPDRTIILLRFGENLHLKEIAEEIGLSITATHKRLMATLQRLRKTLKTE